MLDCFVTQNVFDKQRGYLDQNYKRPERHHSVRVVSIYLMILLFDGIKILYRFRSSIRVLLFFRVKDR